MNTKYAGSTPLKDGDKIQVQHFGDDRWHDGIVQYALASQFTVKYGKYVNFFFYSDKDVTWRLASEPS